LITLHERPDGVAVGDERRVVYDIDADRAVRGPARVEGPAVVWELPDDPGPGEWIVRCDRVDFPPGGVAYRHVHPGPGARRLLHGELTIERAGEVETYRAGDAWFEDAEDAVLATASAAENTAFVRVMLLPAEWAGKRTIRYLDPADEDKPRLQRATVLLEEPLLR
jgi:quercetin dioxygenase-like cupin family protein